MSVIELLVGIPIIGPFLVKIYKLILKKQKTTSKIDWKARKKIYENYIIEYNELHDKIYELRKIETKILSKGKIGKKLIKKIDSRVNYINGHQLLHDKEFYCTDIVSLAKKIKEVDFDNANEVNTLLELVQEQSSRSGKILHEIKERIDGALKDIKK